ncbi:MAG: hypothetical protein IT304_08045 [Dehalococcoidia bacterium]|nr:hypothetical protein [Dehalococcoidia bacterium]
MLYSLIFLSLFTAGWLVCAYLPWLIASVLTRGHAGMRYLPLCLFTGVVGALAVPAFGLTNAVGLWLSFAVAFLAPAALLAARRYAFGHPTRQRRGEASPDIDRRSSKIV